MKHIKCGPLLAVLAGLAANLSSIAKADIASPRAQWTTVRMESETVDIVLGESRVEVTAVFHMQNTGKAASIPIGYPLGVMEKSLNDFKVLVDDQEVKNVRVQGEGGAKAPRARGGFGGQNSDAYRFEGPYKEWKVFDVPMAENEKKTIRVVYWVEPAQVKTTEKSDLLHYVYTLKTGATWKGKIDEALIRVKLGQVAADHIVQATPSGCQKTDSGAILLWTLKDFKPSEDVEITFKPSAPKSST